MSDTELGQHRTQIALDIEQLNGRIGATTIRQKEERRALERERAPKIEILRAIDAEFQRRGQEPRNIWPT